MGQFEFTCVIECKDTAEKVDLETVRGFVARLADLAVTQGVIVAARGFTTDALTFAAANSVLTYTLFDASSTKWADQALLPAIVTFAMLGGGSAEFISKESGNKLFFHHHNEAPPFGEVPLFDTQTATWITLKEYCEHKWDEYADGNYNLNDETVRRVDSSGRYELYASSRRHRVDITYTLTPYLMYTYGRVPLRLGRGFLDHRSDAILLSDDYESDIPIWDAYQKWPRAHAPEAIPFQQPGTFHLRIHCFYHSGGRGGGIPEAIRFGCTREWRGA